MESNLIINKIEERILEINKTTPGYWPTSFYDKDFEDDIDTMELSLMKVKRWLKNSLIILIVMTVLLVIGFMNMKLAIVYKLNDFGLIFFLVSAIGLVRSVYKLHIIKLNLENKIFLVRLLEQMSIND